MSSNLYLTKNKTKEDLVNAYKDLLSSFSHWRIFCLIGINDIRKRYARSRMGQFWLTLSLAVNIAALSFVWAFLFKIRAVDYIPYLSFGLIFWTYMSSCVLEGSNLYITNTGYLKELRIPKLCYLNSLFVRNTVVIFHNLLVLIPIYFFCSVPLLIIPIALSIIGFLLTSIFLYSVSIFISLVGLRFRDFPNIVASLLQVFFYLTPIMWKAEAMPENIQKYMVFNPFAVLLALCRNPMLGIKIPENYWFAAIAYIIIGWLIAFPLFSKFRSRITYWL